jgi:hypothetical protein
MTKKGVKNDQIEQGFPAKWVSKIEGFSGKMVKNVTFWSKIDKIDKNHLFLDKITKTRKMVTGASEKDRSNAGKDVCSFRR